GGALFNAEFGIRHRGSTVPERSGVALSFCRRPPLSPPKPKHHYMINQMKNQKQKRKLQLFLFTQGKSPSPN
ncbi:hypothetical protein, partial [Pseudomonas sp. FSL W5-0203]|uniref:hypothetical protein n=1 Tax=Pseudomonas sp. FSL W5-0203 TaxID=1920491 RepID=UPI001C43D41B